MEIAFDYQAFLQKYGGISRYFYQLSRQLACDPANKVTVVAPLYLNRYLHASPNLRVIGRRVKWHPHTDQFYRKTNIAVSWSALRLIRPNIVHETYYSPIQIGPSSAKVVLTVYDMIHERFTGDFGRNDNTSRSKAIAVARADHVICISEQTQRDVVELLNVNAEKTSVIHLGFDLEMQAVTDSSESAAHPQPFILYVGRREPYKNYAGLLRAYATSPKLSNTVDLICFGGGGFSDEEKNEIRQYMGFARCTVHHRHGDDELLAQLYRSARAFVYPSLYEGFGIPPLEAMSLDCPTVCSNTSSIPEVVGDAAEMFDPYNQESMQCAIERVVFDEAMRRTLIERGRLRIRQFSWETCAQKTMQVYSRVLG